ncbi:MAG: molybdenum cofactor guanylyltransferase [Thermomicrobiales bacterium]|nr:molybdenum cofactor guanylyltransferase [Thermomicrobiales bacterium]
MSDDHPAQISAAILAGGASRRMGTDKALLRLSPGAPTFLDTAIDVASTLTDDVMVIGRQRPDSHPGVRWLPDRFPDAGPLGGIATALALARYPRCLVLSCDAPFLSLEVVRYLCELSSSADAVIPATSASTRQRAGIALQTLHAVYSKRCLEAIEERIVAGDLRTTSWHTDAAIERVPERVIRAIDPDLLTFLSVNTADDLRRARAIAAGL